MKIGGREGNPARAGDVTYKGLSYFYMMGDWGVGKPRDGGFSLRVVI